MLLPLSRLGQLSVQQCILLSSSPLVAFSSLSCIPSVPQYHRHRNGWRACAGTCPCVGNLPDSARQAAMGPDDSSQTSHQVTFRKKRVVCHPTEWGGHQRILDRKPSIQKNLFPPTLAARWPLLHPDVPSWSMPSSLKRMCNGLIAMFTRDLSRRGMTVEGRNIDVGGTTDCACRPMLLP
jgi:hypothetical protein